MPRRQLRAVRLDERDQLLDFLGEQFDAGRELFENMTHLYAPVGSLIRQSHWLLEGDDIVGSYGIFPRKLVLGRAELKAAGIGGVCARHDCRNQGVMTDMIRLGDAMMRRAGIDVAVLGGDRFRYRTFGWDGGGRRYEFRLTKRCLERCEVTPGPVRCYEASRDLARVRRAYESLQHRVVRPKAYFERVLSRPGLEVLVSDAPKAFAYAIVRDGARMIEVAGEPDGVGAIAHGLLAREGVDLVTVETGAECSDLMRWLIHCGEYSRPHISASYQIRIVDLVSCLTHLLPEMRRRARPDMPEGEVTLVMTDSDQSATLRYGRRFVVSRKPCRNKMLMPDSAIATLVLGPYGLAEAFGLKRAYRDLACFLPIPWHWPTPDRL